MSYSQKPINPYGWSKLMAEQMIKQIGDAHKIRYSILRYFNAAGAAIDVLSRKSDVVSETLAGESVSKLVEAMNSLTKTLKG